MDASYLMTNVSNNGILKYPVIYPNKPNVKASNNTIDIN